MRVEKAEDLSTLDTRPLHDGTTVTIGELEREVTLDKNSTIAVDGRTCFEAMPLGRWIAKPNERGAAIVKRGRARVDE